MRLSGINKSYGDNVVFEDFDFCIEEGKITALMGASGCGKTTLLNIISGLTEYSGECEAPQRISYLFQQERLVGNLTAEGNLNYVLHDIKDKTERKKIATDMLERVELSAEAGKYPKELSGGMARRLAIARAFVYKAPLLLMDEPFKGLDVSLKKRITDVFKKIYADDGRTVLFVTHDIDEAVLLADRIVIIEKGGEIIFDGIVDVPRENRVLGDFSELINKLYEIL